LIAFLSVIASFNVVTLSLEEEPVGQYWGRNKLLLVIGLVETVILIPPTWNPEIIEPLDLLFGSGTPVLGGLFAVIAIGWRVKRNEALNQMFATTSPGSSARWLFAWVQWGIPVALSSILIGTVYSALT
jgi:SNF family Na+-dependent transporter